jgi:tetratricopeptide (TPR) repeat protein
VDLAGWVVERHPFDRPTRVRLGLALLRSGESLRAILVFEDLVRDFPGDAVLWANLGTAQAAADRLRDAVDSLEKARRMRPADPALLANLGEVYLGMARVVKYEAEMLDRALTVYESLIRAAPERAAGHIGKARTLIRRDPGDNEVAKAAILLYRKALELEPGSFEAHLNVALLYYDLTVHSEEARSEWYWKAMEHFERAESIRPPAAWDGGAQRAYEDLKER